ATRAFEIRRQAVPARVSRFAHGSLFDALWPTADAPVWGPGASDRHGGIRPGPRRRGLESGAFVANDPADRSRRAGSADHLLAWTAGGAHGEHPHRPALQYR